MITEMITGLLKNMSTKTVNKVVAKTLIKCVSGVEKRLEKRLSKALQKNVDTAVKKAKREIMHASVLMFSIVLVLIGVFLILAKYFPAEYLLIVAGGILFSVTVASR